uniref:BTB domain-containing protein n=1 Tax=Globodera pallida TaxID=36090 RepID=A0A183BUL6_GLOPA
MTLHKCGSVEFECAIGCSVVIRILEKRQMTENPFPPIATTDEGVTVQIADRSVKVSAHLLMAVSPVFDAMLSHNMKEKVQGIADLTETFGTIERFVDFLYHIDPNAVHGPYRPNPKCVLDLLKFARHYQMDGLKERCAVHLVNCVEFPLVERFLLVDTFCLPKLKDFFLRSLSVTHLKAFWKANHAQLQSSSISKELLFDLSVRLCDDE